MIGAASPIQSTPIDYKTINYEELIRIMDANTEDNWRTLLSAIFEKRTELRNTRFQIWELEKKIKEMEDKSAEMLKIKEIEKEIEFKINGYVLQEKQFDDDLDVELLELENKQKKLKDTLEGIKQNWEPVTKKKMFEENITNISEQSQPLLDRLSKLANINIRPGDLLMLKKLIEKPSTPEQTPSTPEQTPSTQEQTPSTQ
jgi:hypothetical protein